MSKDYYICKFSGSEIKFMGKGYIFPSTGPHNNAQYSFKNVRGNIPRIMFIETFS